MSTTPQFKRESFKSSFTSSFDSTPIFYRQWDCADPRGYVFLAHGLSEHSERYSDFAKELVSELQVIVVACDHRGHGYTAYPSGTPAPGTYAEFQTSKEKGKFDYLTVAGADLNQLIQLTSENLPIAIFGHSMGSMITRHALQQMPADILQRVRGVVLSGIPSVPPTIQRRPMLWMVNSAIALGHGRDAVHHIIMDKFDVWIRKLRKDPKLPKNCMISSEVSAIEKFNQDPLCGQVADLHIWRSMGLSLIDMENMSKFFSNLCKTGIRFPFLFISGVDDPLCDRGSTAGRHCGYLHALGFPTTDVRLSGCQHEFLHEKEAIRKEGINITKFWIKSKL